MGDARYQPHYDRIVHAGDRTAHLRDMTGEEIVQALAAASRAADPFLANILATEAMNRLRRIRRAIQHLGEGLCLVDPAGRVLLFNPAGERMTGWSRAEVEGRHVEETVLPSEAWKRALASTEAMHSEDEWLLRKGGARFPASCTLAPVLNAGAADGVVIVFRDATEERRAEAQRRAWTGVMHAFYEAHDVMGEGLLLLTGMRVTYANETFLRMSGYGLDDLSRLPDVMSLVPPSVRASLAERICSCEAGGAGPQREATRLLRRDGKEVPIELAAVGVRAEGPEQVVCIVRERAPPGGRGRGEKEGGAGLSGGRRGPRDPSARP